MTFQKGRFIRLLNLYFMRDLTKAEGLSLKAELIRWLMEEG